MKKEKQPEGTKKKREKDREERIVMCMRTTQ
jgi:hypothetical protein